ncbi:hypothetical protein S7711_06389 [Stachybotrys chartarum IBT 7711]|uniref:Uncharacterized protein n=1 Tax=Stachybotrys chartarum (strain CBS 109288 / IBT 7711) TaxID=1280523 RepID=A0A084AGD1_STACB|nr:hypothetical protein S7711_06389 [Stachybotrys chartarum IBT 7711]KFA72378.1 hypothetical protein S40288_05604 [Stachybotrys chartarum IBT 40288]
MTHFTQDPAAIFSPSVARIAASTARDWSYVDSWLAAKFPGRQPPPSFERNPETLKVLLALASHNEAADEERHLLSRADAAVLQDLAAAPQTSTTLRDGLLAAVEHNLAKEGQVALDTLAQMAVSTGVAFPRPQQLGRNLLQLQADIYEAEQMKARVEGLERQIQQETAQIETLLSRLRGDSFKPPADLAKQNLDMQRRVKVMAARVPDLRDRAATLAASVDSSHPVVDDIVKQENDLQMLLAQKKELEKHMSTFRGLPSNPDVARSELEDLRRQLRGTSWQRDTLFEDLVEQESPAKRR